MSPSPALKAAATDRVSPACPYCGTTHGLRITRRDPRLGYAPDFVCADCFTARDDGPCFDDLEPMPPARRVEVLPVLVPELSAADCKTTKDWERWNLQRREYEEPYAPIGGRY